MDTKEIRKSITSYRTAYLILSIVGIFALVLGNLSWSVISLGFALVFDPFDANQPFQERPLAQRILLIAHTILLFFLLGLHLYQVVQ